MLGYFKKTAAQSVGWAMGIILLLIFAGCSGTEIGNPNNTANPEVPPGDNGVEVAASDAELETYLKDQHAKSINVNRLKIDPPENTDEPNNAVDNVDSNPANAGAKYSQTNNQEIGVEESDVVKTDGDYFYVATDQSFTIVDASNSMEIIATQTIDGSVETLYLYDNKLIVLYTPRYPDDQPLDDPPLLPNSNDELIGTPDWIFPESQHGVAIFDISDRQHPTNLKTIEFDGLLFSSRLINGKLHIIQEFLPILPSLDVWFDGTPEDEKKTINANKEAIEHMTLDQLIPFYRVVDASSNAQVEEPVVTSDNFYIPASKKGGGTVTTIVTFDLDDVNLPFESTSMVTHPHIVYASTEAVYIASHQYNYTKEMSETTSIFKFDLTDKGAQFAGDGSVPGWILNQFSLGEHQDVLRVATTVGHGGGWQPTSRNNIYCLKKDRKKLNVIGKIEDLAPGEKIYAARFMGKRGYLVTYVKIDPLFTLDLSNPSAPKMVGYLKVPGYSNYIHPYGDNYIVTIGKDSHLVKEDAMAWYQGVQLSIFDVSDFSQPNLLHTEIIGDRGTHSEALYNHKAFTFWTDQNLLALPIELYKHEVPAQHPSEFGTKAFEGLYVYDVSPENGFHLRGRINTKAGASQKINYNLWTRGIFVDDQIYAITENAIRFAKIDQVDEIIQTLILEPPVIDR